MNLWPFSKKDDMTEEPHLPLPPGVVLDFDSLEQSGGVFFTESHSSDAFPQPALSTVPRELPTDMDLSPPEHTSPNDPAPETPLPEPTLNVLWTATETGASASTGAAPKKAHDPLLESFALAEKSLEQPPDPPLGQPPDLSVWPVDPTPPADAPAAGDKMSRDIFQEASNDLCALFENTASLTDCEESPEDAISWGFPHTDHTEAIDAWTPYSSPSGEFDGGGSDISGINDAEAESGEMWTLLPEASGLTIFQEDAEASIAPPADTLDTLPIPEDMIRDLPDSTQERSIQETGACHALEDVSNQAACLPEDCSNAGMPLETGLENNLLGSTSGITPEEMLPEKDVLFSQRVILEESRSVKRRIDTLIHRYFQTASFS